MQIDDLVEHRQSFLTSMIDACPLSAELTFIKGIPVRTSIPLFTGDVFHKTYQKFYNLRVAGTDSLLDETIDMFTDTFYEEIKLIDLDRGLMSLEVIRQNIMGLVINYHQTALLVQGVVGTETLGTVTLDSGDTITTHIDIDVENGIIEEKTARVNTWNRKESFPDYNDQSVHWKPQPVIHLLAFPGRSYTYHVVGKGNTVMVGKFHVVHTTDYLETFKRRTLQPAMNMIKSGIFPAIRSGLCTVCPFAKDKEHCGMLAS